MRLRPEGGCPVIGRVAEAAGHGLLDFFVGLVVLAGGGLLFVALVVIATWAYEKYRAAPASPLPARNR